MLPLTRPRFARAPSPTRGEGSRILCAIQFSNNLLRFFKQHPFPRRAFARGLVTLPLLHPRLRGDRQEGGWSAARRCICVARLARGARCPEPPGTRLTALHRGSSPDPGGPGSSPDRASWDAGLRPVPVQRAPRRAVLVPPGRGSGVARVRGYEPRPREPIPIPRRTRRATRPSVDRDEPNLTSPREVGIKKPEKNPTAMESLDYFVRRRGRYATLSVIPGCERSEQARNP